MIQVSSFDQLGLTQELLKAIADQGYTEPTPIQAKVIPPIIEGRDIMGSAETGTGKTASFTLPMLYRLQPHANSSTSPAKHPTRALILAPTRELATQIYGSVKEYGKYLQLRCAVIYGGVNIDPQIKELQAGVEILVATPGRLLDHIEQRTANLSKIEIIILDEADRMLDMGFLPDIKRILALLPAQRQSLIFSATFNDEIRKLADKLLKQPLLIEVAKRNAINESIAHVVHMVSTRYKFDLLLHLLKQADSKPILIFVRTKQGVDYLVKQLLQSEILVAAIHGDKNQQQRTQALSDFKEGKIKALVATDIAARGLDIENLNCVINFELPTTPEDYIHRIGRTGRAGCKGNAISLISASEKELLINIEKLLGTKLEIKEVPGFGVEETGDNRSSNRLSQSPTRSKERQPQSNSYPKKRKNTPPIDPIFTQPYVPPVLTDKTNAVDGITPRTFKSAKKVIAALFAPPINQKLK